MVRLLPLRACTLCPVAVSLFLAACGTVQLADSWKDPAFTGPALRNVLVVGVTSSDTNRRLFEDRLSQSLRDAGVKAVSSYTLIPETGTTGKDRINETVAKTGSDAVMVTRVQSAEKRVDVSPTMPYRSYGMGFDGWYGGAASAAIVNEYDLLTVETTLWDTKTRKIVWSGTSKVLDPKDVAAVTNEFAQILIAKMRQDGVL